MQVEELPEQHATRHRSRRLFPLHEDRQQEVPGECGTKRFSEDPTPWQGCVEGR